MADKFHGDFPVRVPSVCAASAGSADAVRLWGSCSDLEVETVADLLHDEVDDTLESRLAAVKLKLTFEAEQLFNSDVVDAFPFFDKAVYQLKHPPAAAAASAPAEPTVIPTLNAYINGFFTEADLRDAKFVDYVAARSALRARILPALEKIVYAFEPLPPPPLFGRSACPPPFETRCVSLSHCFICGA